jgi:formylglycine-generating enzyme required for sulfatase activity
VELLQKYGRYSANSASHTWPVGSLKPNDWGLFDMHGNVWNWCMDRHAPYAKPQGGKPLEDNENKDDVDRIVSTADRVWRGGSFIYLPVIVRSANRTGHSPYNRGNFVGFRPARTYR